MSTATYLLGGIHMKNLFIKMVVSAADQLNLYRFVQNDGNA